MDMETKNPERLGLRKGVYLIPSVFTAANIGMGFYALLAYISVRTRYRARGVLDFLTWVPATIPGIILGLGMLWMFLSTPPDPVLVP